jgi:adhesin transport system outer membrane protein
VPVLSLRQLLFDGGQSKERVALKEIEARGAWLTELSALSTRSFVAVEAIIGLQRDRKLQAQAELNSNRIQEIVDDLQSRFDGGVGSVADLLAGQGRSSNAQTELGNARSQVQLASTRWVEFFGFAPGQLPNVPLAPSALRGASMADVIANSPRMREQAEVTQARMRSLSIAQRSGRPTISAIVETDFDQGSFRDPVQARLGVSAPIYRGGAVKANVAAAEAALAESKANEEALQRELTRALSEALVETNSVKGRLSSARKSVEINTEALEAARGQFEIGRGSLLQILDALRELNVAQAQVIQLEADALSAEYAILATTGDILDVLGIVQPVDPTR